jgi:CHAT domain-containing protein
VQPPGEPQSLVQVFLDAGSRSVIATQWRVDDAAAPIIVRAFYQSVLQGISYASALAQAKLALMQYETEPGGKPPFAHPFYWANYVLIGE